jgi:hypothetical protein
MADVLAFLDAALKSVDSSSCGLYGVSREALTAFQQLTKALENIAPHEWYCSQDRGSCTARLPVLEQCLEALGTFSNVVNDFLSSHSSGRKRWLAEAIPVCDTLVSLADVLFHGSMPMVFCGPLTSFSSRTWSALLAVARVNYDCLKKARAIEGTGVSVNMLSVRSLRVLGRVRRFLYEPIERRDDLLVGHLAKEVVRSLNSCHVDDWKLEHLGWCVASFVDVDCSTDREVFATVVGGLHATLEVLAKVPLQEQEGYKYMVPRKESAEVVHAFVQVLDSLVFKVADPLDLGRHVPMLSELTKVLGKVPLWVVLPHYGTWARVIVWCQQLKHAPESFVRDFNQLWKHVAFSDNLFCRGASGSVSASAHLSGTPAHMSHLYGFFPRK